MQINAFELLCLCERVSDCHADTNVSILRHLDFCLSICLSITLEYNGLQHWSVMCSFEHPDYIPLYMSVYAKITLKYEFAYFMQIIEMLMGLQWERKLSICWHFLK